MFVCGYVAVLGEPNAGKSSLVNALVGEKVAIVTPKAQTTRENVLGIYNSEESQIVFVDTPGIHRSYNKLDSYMSKNVRTAIESVDLAVYVFDGTKPFSDEQIKYIENLSKKVKIIVAVSKTDLTKYEKLYPQLAKLSVIYNKIIEVVPYSAKTNEEIQFLLEKIEANLPHYEEKTLIYDQDMYTDRGVRYLCGEIVREKAMLKLEEEIPHGIAVEIIEFKEKGKLATISADIICEKQSHKGIVIGKNGSLLKEIGTMARYDMEKLLNKKVMLTLYVKAKEFWRNNPSMLNEIGYKQSDDNE